MIQLNPKTKKIIAREFLILLGSPIVFFLISFAWVLLVDLNHKREDEIKEKIEHLTSQLTYSSNNIMNEELLQLVYSNLETDASFDEFKDSFQENEELQQLGYSTLETDASFDEFKADVFEDTLNIPNSKEVNAETENGDFSSVKKEISILKKKLKNTQNSLFNSDVNGDVIWGLAIILLILLFPFRFLVYATKWSIKQLRN